MFQDLTVSEKLIEVISGYSFLRLTVEMRSAVVGMFRNLWYFPKPFSEIISVTKLRRLNCLRISKFECSKHANIELHYCLNMSN